MPLGPRFHHDSDRLPSVAERRLGRRLVRRGLPLEHIRRLDRSATLCIVKPGWAEQLGDLRVPNPKSKEIRRVMSGQKPRREPPVKPKPRRNVETKFREAAATKGWNVHRRGWPDFVLTTETETLLVEVKSWDDKLSKGQRTLFEAIERLGVKVYVWWEREPDKLMPWRKFLERSGFVLRIDKEKRSASPTNRNPPRYSAGAVKRMVRRAVLIERELERELGGRD